MKNHRQEVWVGVDELNKDQTLAEQLSQEFVGLPVSETLQNPEVMQGLASNRRDFLKYLGFGLGAATIAAGCEIPVRRAVPYVTKPDTIVPGIATYYATSFVNGGDYCAVLVKTREGRPIKIEGNDLSGVTKGGTSARAQASILSLYDQNRIQGPGKVNKGSVQYSSWEELDKAVKGKLAGAQVRIVTNTIMSPTAKKALGEFTQKYPGAKVVTYDAVSSAALLLANEQSFGMRVVPDYHFDKAEVIVSFGADFLGTWISPVEYAGQYVKNRKVDVKNAKISRHYQVESHMSMTGSNADNRVLIRPSEMGAAIATLYNLIAQRNGAATVSAPALNENAKKALQKISEELVKQSGKSLIVCGSNNVGEQVLVNAMNSMLGNIGATLDFGAYSLQRQGNEKDAQALLAEMKSNGVGALIFWGANPVFELPNGAEFAAAMKNVPLKVSFASVLDETTVLCDHAAPDHHFLESWGDAEPKKGHYSLIQPTISPLFNTRQAEESLLRWSESANLNVTVEQPYYEYLKSAWQSSVYGPGTGFATFQTFWDSVLHDGVYTSASANTGLISFRGDISAAGSQISKPGKGLEIAFYETVAIGGGQYAGNPWLQEMPDPVTRCAWGNYLAIPIKWDGVNKFFDGFKKGLKDGDLLTVKLKGKDMTLPVIRQFGQLDDTLAIAIGYGRTQAGICGTGVGHNLQPMMGIQDGLTQYYAADLQLGNKAGTEDHFSCVQYHHTMGVKAMGKEEKAVINADEKTLGYKGFQGSLTGRSVIRQTNISDLKKFVEELKEQRHEFQALNKETVYPGHEERWNLGHHWGMHIDLNACIGCGACSIACMSENNVPVVGKREVARHHEMSWIRIDRYYYGDMENPQVVYQPLMCQHCDNAPCENVCPVAATNHSNEGINQMTYNRCIGTRYCANNCPYKVRRFNWLDYTTADIFANNENYSNDPNMEDAAGKPFLADSLVRMVLNPDVTVRSRGVIEKCSFCMQRIQEGKLTAKKESRAVADGEIKTACQSACPTGAIVFGDRNNPDTMLHKMNKSELNYAVLEEVNVAPNVLYSARIHNRNEGIV